tara:strand:+ start:332 stop:526 length:195 start_codon:yes stop_codon:yes gene_type:complete
MIDRNQIISNNNVWAEAVAMADAVIAASDKHEGMMLAWRGECVKGQATHIMLQKIKDRYSEISA